MYICQDKCYRLVPPQDHRYAQSKNYLRGARFCGICKVVYNKDTEAFKAMQDSILCPCCAAKTRGYFDVDKKRIEFVLRNVLDPIHSKHSLVFNSTETFHQIVERVFKSQDIQEEQTLKQKARKEVRKPVAAPSTTTKNKKSKAMIATKLVKLTMYPVYKPMEISMFPTQQQ